MLVLALLGACSEPEDPTTEAAASPSAAVEAFEAGEVAYAAGEFTEAADLYASAAEQAQTGGDAAFALRARAQRAVALKMAGDTTTARGLMRSVLAEARAARDARTEGLALGNLARLASLENDLGAALTHLDELADWARAFEDTRVEVETLEQAVALCLERSDAAGALERLERALAVDRTRPEEERRERSLVGQKAGALALLGDDEGAQDLWGALGASGPALANRARHLSDMGLHAVAAEFAREAAHVFDAMEPRRPVERDRATLLMLSELLRAGDVTTCDERLSAILEQGVGGDAALAPFRVMRARLALVAGSPLQALAALDAARASIDVEEDARHVDRLTAVALILLERHDEAVELLERQPGDVARATLLAWTELGRGARTGLASEAVPDLRPAHWDAADDSWRELDALVPGLIPSPSWLSLDLHLADVALMREQERFDLADRYLGYGVIEALAWHAIESRPKPPASGAFDVEAAVARARAWVEGGAGDDEALVVMLPGAASSYLVVCTSAGATTFGLTPEATLRRRAALALAALRGDGPALFEALNGEWTSFLQPAGAVLADVRTWHVVAPDFALGVPWSTLLPEMPAFGNPPRFVVHDHDVVHWPTVPALPGDRAELVHDDEWITAHRPIVEPWEFPLTAELHRERFGEDGFAVAPATWIDGGVAIAGEALTRSMVAALANEEPARAMLLSVPGFGGGRIGGVVLSGDPQARFTDERGGWVPWHRWRGTPLPHTLILDGTRFDPLAIDPGIGDAADALLTGTAEVAFTRWPLPDEVRDSQLRGIAAGLGEGSTLASAVAEVQRSDLVADPARHPRLWGAWLVFGSR